MNIRWLWFDYVPPELDLSDDDRRAVRQRARQLRPKGKQHAINRKANRIYQLIYAPVAFLYLGWILWSTAARHRGQPVNDVTTLAVFGVLLAGMWFAWAYSRGKTYATFVCRALRERGHDVCPDCGYLLRGLGDDVKRCPECGWIRENTLHEAAVGQKSFSEN